MPPTQRDPFPNHPPTDADWTEEHWHSLLATLIGHGILSWREVTALTLGHLNPSQVSTSIASKPAFQRNFEPRKTWLNVRKWHFDQSGRCADCGTRLELQADHMVPKEIVGEIGALALAKYPKVTAANIDGVRAELGGQLDAAVARHNYSAPTPAMRSQLIDGLVAMLESGIRDRSVIAEVADRLDNLVLRCRRCNVIRLPSHANGGKTFLTAESALMWLLLVKRPQTYEAFQDLCRNYGMTMANIRFEEAWAMAIWLARAGLYEIDPDSKYVP